MIDKLAQRLDRHTSMAVAAIGLVTALLVVPFLTMAPTQSASTEPGGDIFTARDLVDESFASSIRDGFFIVEAVDGDMLTADNIRALAAASEQLRNDPDIGPALLSFFESETATEVRGPLSLADFVVKELDTAGVALADADDAAVKEAGAAIIERYGEANQLLGLSTQSSIDGNGTWTVPAVTMLVFSDNNVLGLDSQAVNLGGGTEGEEYDRSIQTVLRSAPGLQVHGVAIDVNLTSQEQGAVAGPFIGFTILAVLLIVGLTFRSYWVLSVVSVALITLIVWLKGISNLLGLEDDLVLSLIVPIAMISFGVDFAIHSIGRYREERSLGLEARAAYRTSTSAITGALLLALASGVAAFLSNVVSGIESIIQFGVGAAIALTAAYLLLGVIAPLVIARIEASVPPPAPGRRSTIARLAGALATTSLTMAAVLMLVFVLPWLGVVLGLLTLVLGIVAPLALQRRKVDTNGPTAGSVPVAEAASALAGPLGSGMAAVARKRWIVLPAALALSGAASVLAAQVPAEFDVNDFFAADTDFVVGLDQLDAHVGERSGEPALVYVESDLTDPSALASRQNRLGEIRELDSEFLAKSDGQTAVEAPLFEVFDAAWDSPVMANLVLAETGVELTDTNSDGIPDTTEQINALFAVASATGVPLDEARLLLTPDAVQTAVLFVDDNPDRTIFELGLVNSRDQASLAEARSLLEPITERISQDAGGTFVQVTGGPFVREASLQATNDALQTSLPIAVVLCFIVAAVALRSLRYGLASIVPILMVVSWLYAVMELAGYNINIVTATIAAVSVGIGIDFAIHFIARYREELERLGDRTEAVAAAGNGTGVALVASAMSSSVGFGILALAPMPLFAAYGLLTALMIMMALTATLVVLPSLLMFITTDDRPVAASPENDVHLDLSERDHSSTRSSHLVHSSLP